MADDRSKVIWHRSIIVKMLIVVLLALVTASRIVDGRVLDGRLRGSAGYLLDAGENARVDDDDDDDNDDGRNVVYVPMSRSELTNDVTPRAELDGHVRSYARNPFRRKRMERSLAEVRKKALEQQRPLNAGEILQILRRVAQNRGSMSRGRLKGMRFGVSRKRSPHASIHQLAALLGRVQDGGDTPDDDADAESLESLLVTALQEAEEDGERLSEAGFDPQDQQTPTRRMTSTNSYEFL